RPFRLSTCARAGISSGPDAIVRIMLTACYWALYVLLSFVEHARSENFEARLDEKREKFMRLRWIYRVLFLTLMAVTTGWIFVAANLRAPELVTAVQSTLWGPVNSAQLVYYDPLPAGAMDEDRCEGPPVVVGTALAADHLEDGAGADASGQKPVRMIRHLSPSYSFAAVPSRRNELVLTDEIFLNFFVYNRLDNPSPASVTEPKRAIGGLKTKIEFQSGVYIDPKNGDIYAVNNDTVDTLVVFSGQAKGDVRPERELHTPHGTFGIA